MTIEWQHYAATDSYYDELIASAAGPRPAARALCEYLASLSDQELRERKTAAELAILVMGITFTVYTEGGFRKNKLYNELLASVLPHNNVSLTNMKEATAAGCAMSALMALSGKTGMELGKFVNIEHTPVQGVNVTGYEAYKSMWLKLVRAGSTIYEGK